MEVTSSNNVRIYNLSCGKSLPDWLSERKRRMLQKKNVDVRKRIQLIQDFEMPIVSTNVKVSRDGKYILATGVYKPRIRCFEADNLSMKFERCFDAEAVKFEILSDDYSKIALLQCDRTVEFHAQYGRYYKLRIPKFGRDMMYHPESCDLMVVGAGPEVYRFNLEQGRFLRPFKTNASAINKIVLNPGIDFIFCGTEEGKIEAWDPRMRERIETLDVAVSCMAANTNVEGFPSVTALAYKGNLTLAVGTHTGQILLYDIRTNKPFTVKDHMYGLPIKNIDFKNEDLVASLDPKCVKLWNSSTGKPYTTIQAPALLNDLCIVPDTGLLFLANEDKKILTYFIPSIGPAPSWCCFLDNITEELEESQQDAVYDDYKFVTKKELEELHLGHLEGTNLLRAYMHGYFMDIRLYNKAKSIVQPTAFKDFKRKMIRDKIEMERKSQIVLKKLPSVNGEYAQKLLEKKVHEKLKVPTPLEDTRFKDLFENPDFVINDADEEYARIKSTVEKMRKKKVGVVPESQQLDALEDEERAENSESSEYTSSSEEGEESSEEEEANDPQINSPPKKKSNLIKAMDSHEFSMLRREKDDQTSSLPIGERLKSEHESVRITSGSSAGNKVITFTLKKKNQDQTEKQSKRDQERKAHIKERMKFRRSAKFLRK